MTGATKSHVSAERSATRLRALGALASILRRLRAIFGLPARPRSPGNPVAKPDERQPPGSSEAAPPRVFGIKANGNKRTIDLRPLRERLGDHWERYADALFSMAERLIKKEIGPRDQYERAGDAFVIVFDGSSGMRAAKTIAAIERKLSELLFGTPSSNSPPPTKAEPATKVGDVSHGARFRRSASARAYMRKFPSLLGRIMRPKRTRPLAAPMAAPQPETSRGQFDGGQSHILGRSDVDLRARKGASIGERDMTSSRPEDRPGMAQDASPELQSSIERPEASSDHDATLAPSNLPTPVPVREADGDSQRLQDAIVAATLRIAGQGALVPPAIEATLKRVRFVYRPIWHVNSRQLLIYRCTPVIYGDDKVIEGAAALPYATLPYFRSLLDHLTLSSVALDMEASKRNFPDTLLALPIHFATLGDKWSAEPLLELLQYVQKLGRQRLIIEILDAAEGRTDSRFPVSVRLLRKFGGKFGANLPSTAHDMKFWRDLGITLAGFDASNFVGAEEDLSRELERFLLTARREALSATVSGLKTRSQILTAATMGFDLVHGTHISQFPEAGALRRAAFDFADIYAGA